NTKPSAAPRSTIRARFAFICSALTPYLVVKYSAASAPSGAMVGLSSNGCMCSSTSPISPPTFSSARSSEFRPIAHHGHATSETKSILIARAPSSREHPSAEGFLEHESHAYRSSLLHLLLDLGRDI